MEQIRPTFEECLKVIERSANYLANRVSRCCKIEFDDAKQELLIAAWKAYQTYDASQSKFTTYGCWRLRNVAKTLISQQRRDLVESNTITESVLRSDSLSGEGISLEQLAIDHRSSPEEMLITKAEEDLVRLRASIQLNRIEHLLRRLVRWCPLVRNKHAYRLFVRLRYGEKQRADGKWVPSTLTEIAEELGLGIQRLSAVYNEVIMPLGTKKGRMRIRLQIQTAKEAAKENGMAKKVKEEAVRGRTPQKGGLREKIGYLRTHFVEKGKTRAEAVAGLMAKYPDISINYGRTVVYSLMKEERWTSLGKEKPKASVEKEAAKKEAPKKETPKKKSPAKAAPVVKKGAKTSKEPPKEEVEEDSTEGDDEYDF